MSYTCKTLVKEKRKQITRTLTDFV